MKGTRTHPTAGDLLQFAPAAGEADIGALLAQGEGPRVEFTSSARGDLKEHEKNGELQKVIVKVVAGFLNSEGGTLFISVDDDTTVVGLQRDYQTVQEKNWLRAGPHTMTCC